MPKVPVYNMQGEKVSETNVADSVFGVEINDALLHQVYVVQKGNQRDPIAHAKDRGERHGSGKKPFRQKGTGNARQGSVRSPLNRKGGVTFGPSKDRNFKRQLNRKMRQKGLLMALSGKVSREMMVVIDKIVLKEQKTKDFAKTLQALKVKGKAVVGFTEKEQDLRRFCQNIAGIDPVLTKNLSVMSLLDHKFLVLSSDSVKYLESQYSPKDKE
ncbi:50S ribosomal protein L4 [Patescibacteria group bacterium]|nr:MAG: 50S ribosomal protein L4 [Patescibacteria group bacterium]